MRTKGRKGLVEDKELYLSVSGVGYSKEELDEIIDEFNIDTPEGTSGAIDALQKYMNSSRDDAADVIGKLRYRGSRKGSTKEEVVSQVFGGDDYMYDEYLEDMSEYGVANWSVQTWNEWFQKYENGLDPEGEDRFLEMHRMGSNGSRKGSCAHCERPENLSSIASSIVSGMNRKISEPSRKGAPAFATGNSGAISKDVSNLLKNQTVSNKLQKTFGTEAQKQQAINNENKIKENNEQIALNNKLANMTDKERQDYENNQAVNQRVKDKLAKDTQDDMYDEIMGDYDRLRASNQKKKQEMFK